MNTTLSTQHLDNSINTTPSTQHHLHNTIYTTSSTLHHPHNIMNTTPSTQHHLDNIINTTSHYTIYTTPSRQHHQHNTIYTTPSTQHHLHNIINTTPSTPHHQHYTIYTIPSAFTLQKTKPQAPACHPFVQLHLKSAHQACTLTICEVEVPFAPRRELDERGGVRPPWRPRTCDATALALRLSWGRPSAWQPEAALVAPLPQLPAKTGTASNILARMLRTNAYIQSLCTSCTYV